MRAPQLCLQNVIAGDALILRKAPPAVHPADRRVVAGEVLLQPRKLPLRFYIQNTITEMLLQSHMGFIQLLPALPDAWKEGSVRGICAKGNFEVDMIWENGLLKEATILSKSGERCIVKYAGKTLSFKTVKGHSYQLKYDSVKGELLKR